jgi:hypothetical protein
LGAITNSLDGIVAVPGSVNIVLRNGFIYGTAQDGVNLSTVDHATVENVLVQSAGGHGIAVGAGSRVINCDARLCSDTGITGWGAQFIGCTSMDNSDYGFSAGDGSSLTDCISVANYYGFYVGDGACLRNCTANDNDFYGFYAVRSGVFDNCGATGNLTGFDGGYSSVLRGCTAKYNSGSGIYAGFGTTVVHCTTSGNTGDGIGVGNDCVILENNCWSNGFQTGDGAGIHCFNGNNRVEGNQCTTNDRGIETDGGGSLIIRNSLRSNTVGPSVTSATIGASSNPHANYVY